MPLKMGILFCRIFLAIPETGTIDDVTNVDVCVVVCETPAVHSVGASENSFEKKVCFLPSLLVKFYCPLVNAFRFSRPDRNET